jgi:hypothetical protein
MKRRLGWTRSTRDDGRRCGAHDQGVGGATRAVFSQDYYALLFAATPFSRFGQFFHFLRHFLNRILIFFKFSRKKREKDKIML